jgi:hypothetical protein
MPFFKKALSMLNPIKTVQKVVSYANTVLNGRNNYPPSARKVLETHGSKSIKSMVIIRQPIQSFINKVFNGLTFGAFQKKLDELPYDDLFHLRMVVTLDDGTRIQIEKADVINISTTITAHSRQEEMSVPINKSLTLTDLVNGGQKVLGSNTFSYRAFGNNCQDYQMALLKGSSLDTPALSTFIKQDTSELATLSPALVKVANAATDLGGKMNEIIKGTGIKKKHKDSHIVQSVTFDSKRWTTKEARKWLTENNYISSKVDRKLNTLRFRQRDPEEFREGFKYTTHRLPHGIHLIIVYQSVKGNGINTPNTWSFGNGLDIHIDYNSHNATKGSKAVVSGDGMNFFTGKEQPKTSMRPPGYGGALSHDFMQLQTSERPVQAPRFSDYKISSQHPLFNNIKTSDIRDLRALFKQLSDEDKEDKIVTKAQGDATKARVKREVAELKKLTARNKKTRGSTENKRDRLKSLRKKHYIKGGRLYVTI